MRAVVCHAARVRSTRSSSRTGTAPVPGEGQVVVDVRAAGVNFVDGLHLPGALPDQAADARSFPGSEIAGEVSAVGPGVAGVSVGDRVIAFTGFGGFADQAVVPALSLVPMPDTHRASTRPPRSSRATAPCCSP